MAAQVPARGLQRQSAGGDAAARRRGGARARPAEAGVLTYRYEDRGAERTASFPADPREDVSGAVASASSGPLRDYQDKLKAITLRERGMEKAEIAAKLGRSEHWVKRWWREHPATLERPAGARDVVLQKAGLHSFRDLDIRRRFTEDASLFETLKEQVVWRQAKVVSRDQNTGELALRYDERGRSIRAGRQVSDYTGGLDVLDKLLQRVFSVMDIRDTQARIFMNYYADGQERTGVHRHDFWTCLLSFGANRILTVDGRPMLLRDGDLVVFGTQNHGVPVMPEITSGRISLVIFFYPDSDNLERQWKTITDDGEQDEEVPRATGPAPQLHVGVDRNFNAALLWSGTPAAPGRGGCCEGHAPGGGGSAEVAALAEALDPGTRRRSLLKSPNSSLQFEDGGGSASRSGPAAAAVPTVLSACCDEGASDARAAEKQLFGQLERHGARTLWDLRARPPRGSWSEPESPGAPPATRAARRARTCCGGCWPPRRGSPPPSWPGPGTPTSGARARCGRRWRRAWRAASSARPSSSST
ncbi:unnamed protein product [Prorocentrum cordatum]|uniref:Fe2OG dioxygenase domain-containing protein n=1 Tax=Prorocentrum cordatum TaxID=2364126 RepID=A0ABN9S8M2_9DINO|nr:unnamed protein product [Polarella glacialis]